MSKGAEILNATLQSVWLGCWSIRMAYGKNLRALRVLCAFAFIIPTSLGAGRPALLSDRLVLIDIRQQLAHCHHRRLIADLGKELRGLQQPFAGFGEDAKMGESIAQIG